MIGNNLGTNYYICNRTKSIDYEGYSIHPKDSKKERY